MNKLENIKNIKYKLSIYNKINYYQLLLINDINSTIINIVNNYNTNNIILFNLFYENILKINTKKNIININNANDYNEILNLYNTKNNIVIVSNHNNIFCKKWTKDELYNIFNKYKNLLFIIDETYIYENLKDIFSCVDFINLFHNIIVIKTFNNIFKCNIKYIVSNVKLINEI